MPNRSPSAACSSAFLLLDLLRADLAIGRERELERRAVVARHRGRLQDRLQDHLPVRWRGARSASCHERRSMATSTLPASAACGHGHLLRGASGGWGAVGGAGFGGSSGSLGRGLPGRVAVGGRPPSTTAAAPRRLDRRRLDVVGRADRTGGVADVGRRRHDGRRGRGCASRSRRSRRASRPAGVGVGLGHAWRGPARARARGAGEVVHRMSFWAASSRASTRASSAGRELLGLDAELARTRRRGRRGGRAGRARS